MAKTRSGGKSKVLKDDLSKEHVEPDSGSATESDDATEVRDESPGRGDSPDMEEDKITSKKSVKKLKLKLIGKEKLSSAEEENECPKVGKGFKGKKNDKSKVPKKTAEIKTPSKGKKVDNSVKEAEDVKPVFYGFKCYFDTLITEVKKVGSKMDNRTKELLMKTCFAGFFKAILEGKITSEMVEKCDASPIDIIHMYDGAGRAFRLTKDGPLVELKESTVSCVFGIKMGGKLFDTHERIIGKPGMFEGKYFPVRRITRKELGIEMKKLVSKEHIEDEERQDLVKMLILYSFATFFFANTSGTVAKAIVKKFDDMAYINRCCWPTLVHSYLLESIAKHYKSPTPNVSGCVYILLYFFLEHTHVVKAIEGREAGEPRMTKWLLGEATGEKWAETLERNAARKSTEIVLILTEVERENLGISSNSSYKEVAFETGGHHIDEMNNCGVDMDLTVVHEEGKDVARDQAKTCPQVLVEKEQRSKKYHDDRRKKRTETTEVESQAERQETLQYEVVLQEQDNSIKDLIARATGYKVQLKDKDGEILKASETIDSLSKQLEFMREEKKEFDKEMCAEKQRYLKLYDRDIIVVRKLKNAIVEKDAMLGKLKEEIKNLKVENAELTTLAGEMGNIKADNIHLSKQIEHLNSVVHELSGEGINMGGIVHEVVPLKTVQTTDDFVKMPSTRGRGRAGKKVVDDSDREKTAVYKRKQKDLPPPSSMTKRVKGRHSKEVLPVGVIEEKDGTEKLIYPLNSRFFSLLSPGIRSLLSSYHMYSSRSTPVWESEDSLGKLNLNAGMVEDLYIGSWLSSDLVDWYFRWRIPNLRDKYPGIRDTQMSGCFSLRAASYTNWKSDVTRESGMNMVRTDIAANLKYNAYQSAMFVPMLVAGNHWVLLILDIDNLQWYVYNSRPEEDFQRDEATVAADSFRKYLQKILLPKIKKARSDNSLVFQKNILQEIGPVQEYQYDFVLFICKYAEHRLMGGSYIWDQHQVDKLRAEFITAVLSTDGNTCLSYWMK